LRLPVPGAFSLARSRFDDLLITAARGDGAGVVHGAFLSIEDAGQNVRIRYRDERGEEQSIDARVAIGADGAWSSVARSAGLSGQAHRGGRWAVGGHLRGQPDGDALEMFVGPSGYYARNPLGDGATNEMLVTPVAATGERAERDVEEITGGRRRFDAASLVKRVAVGPLRYDARGAARGRVFLAGDAAGLLDPFVGQGIAIALETSIAVADAVSATLRGEPLTRIARRFGAARRCAVFGRKALAAAVNAVIRTPFLRERSRRSIERDPAGAEAILAAVAGAVPASHAFSPRAIAGLLA
jgi:2-polyprenyl-6-methoxyphenol hydroxylase-like FAD-dependent oxidoreductase